MNSAIAVSKILSFFSIALIGVAGVITELGEPSIASAASERSVAGISEITLDSSFDMPPDPLTTEKIWTLEPHEANPHRQRWVLQRDLELLGLQTSRTSQGKFKVHADQLKSVVRLYIRGPGPWFHSYTDFRCEQEPDYWFGTSDGARVAGKLAADQWEELIDSKRVKLGLLLSHIEASSPEDAVLEAKELFGAFKEDLRSDWWVKAHLDARASEWRYYLKQAHESNLCKKKEEIKKAQLGPLPSWESMMEPPSPSTLPVKLLTRAPARKWDGLFTIRATVNVADKVLDGQFLVDSGSSESVLSPSWLSRQGVNPAFIIKRGSHPRRVIWSGGVGAALETRVFEVAVAELPIPIEDFLIMETTIFNTPTHTGSCCDGILGVDFLKNYAVEFLPGVPSAIKLWAREGFHYDGKWVEVSVTPRGDLMSDCLTTAAGEAETVVPGVRWDTGNEMALDFHLPWKNLFSDEKPNWELRCDQELIASKIPVSVPEMRKPAGGMSPFEEKIPGVTVGMSLMSRGPFVMDLSHGRVWFTQKGLDQGFLSNESGLNLEYFMDSEGDRRLKTASITGKGPSEVLENAGLKKGVLVTQVDGRAEEDMDQWEVDQRLSGAFGNIVTIQWKTKQGLKMAPMKVR